MTDEEMMQLMVGDRIVVRFGGREMPAAVVSGPQRPLCMPEEIEVSVVLDAHEGEPLVLYTVDVVCRVGEV